MNLASITREFKELPLALVDEPTLASRSSMDDAKMAELVDSIRASGLLQPMIVARVGDRYEVIAGHRRRIACGRAGLVAAPCIVYPSADAALEAIKYAENRHREELSPSDEAIWFSELLERDCGGDVDRLCAQLGEKRAYVEGRLSLLAGDEAIFEALEHNKIGIGVAQQLNKCTDLAHRRMLLHQAIIGGATVAVAAGWISEWRTIHQPATQNLPPSPPPAPAGAISMSNFFTCVICGRDDNVHLMQPRNMHTHCEQAVFADMLALWKQRDFYLRRPRTLQEASDLIAELAAEWHIGEPEDPRRI